MTVKPWTIFLAFAPLVAAQDAGDGCGSALDSLNRIKETFYANAESLNHKLAYSNLVTATRNCPDWAELWYYRALLGKSGGEASNDTNYSLRKAKELGWTGKDLALGQASGGAVLPPDIGTKWALLVGVGTFQDSKATKLKFAAADATGIRDLLIDPNVGRFPAANVRLLTNDAAKIGAIREGIGWLRQKAQPSDLVVVYIASHGLPRTQDPNGVSYIVAHDSSLKSPATRYATSLQMVDLVNDLTRELQALRLILVLDTCYSGDAASAEGQGAVSTMTIGQSTSFNEALRLFQSGAGRIVMTAAAADQKSYESDSYGHGYFTYFLLHAMKESAGRITMGELYEQVKTATEKTVQKDAGKLQTPLMIAGAAAAGISLGMEPAQQTASAQ